MSCYRVDDYYKVSFDYDKEKVDQIKTVRGRRWEKPYWYVPVNRHTTAQLKELGFLDQEYVEDYHEPDPDFSFFDELPLRGYQKESITRMIKDFHMSGIFADEMGLGKTAEAILAVWSLRKNKKALPALVVCPAFLKTTWEREINKWTRGEATVKILNGKKPADNFKVNTDFTIINYEIISAWYKTLKNRPFRTILVDECHRLKHWYTKWTKAIRGLAFDIKNHIGLSGTPIDNRPIDFFIPLTIFAPGLFNDQTDFGMRYCDPRPNKYTGYIYDGASNTKELHEKLKTAMIRHLKADVLDDLPSKRRIVIPVSVSLGSYKRKANEIMSKSESSDADAMVWIEACKQAAVEVKMNAAIDYIKEFLESGKKLVVYAYHKAALDRIKEAFPDCVRIDGSVPSGKRQELVDRFQEDPDCRLFIGNIQAAGTGITLTAASDTLTIEFGWIPGEHAQAEDRVHRISQKADSITAQYLVAEGTIEEEIMAILDRKMADLSEVLDGKEIDPSSLFESLLKKYKFADKKQKKSKKAKEQPAMAMAM